MSGDHVVAVIEGTVEPVVDGTAYIAAELIAEVERYHSDAVQAHKVVLERPPALPEVPAAWAAARHHPQPHLRD